MNRVICLVAIGIAAQAWPCAGEVCLDEGAFAHIDGGVPSNFFPLVLTDHRNAYEYSDQWVQLRQHDGGLVATQVRTVDALSVAVESPLLLEGERYQLTHGGGCGNAFSGPSTTFTHEFIVLPPLSLPTDGVSIEVADAGIGAVHQYSGGTCSEGVGSTFANFRFDVRPSLVPMLPFLAWKLSLQPLDGGSLVEWNREPIGAVLRDGTLRRLPNPQLAPRRISTVFHACERSQFFPVSEGAPPGRYRAVLHGMLLGSDAGFVTVGPEFELAECSYDAGPSYDFDGGSHVVTDPYTETDGGPWYAFDAGGMDAGSGCTGRRGDCTRGCSSTSQEGSLALFAGLGLLLLFARSRLSRGRA